MCVCVCVCVCVCEGGGLYRWFNFRSPFRFMVNMNSYNDRNLGKVIGSRQLPGRPECFFG